MTSLLLQDVFPIFIHLSDKILSRALNLHLRASGSVQVSCLSEVRLRSLSSLTLGPVHIYRPTDLDLQGPTIKVSSQSELGCNFCRSPQLIQLQPESNEQDLAHPIAVFFVTISGLFGSMPINSEKIGNPVISSIFSYRTLSSKT